MITAVEKEYTNLLGKLVVTSDKALNKAVEESETLIDAAINVSTASKKKKYQELKGILAAISLKKEARLFYLIRLYLTLKEDGMEYNFENIDAVVKEFKGLKCIVNSGRDISERLQMLYDKLFYLKTNKELSQLGSYEER